MRRAAACAELSSTFANHSRVGPRSIVPDVGSTFRCDETYDNTKMRLHGGQVLQQTQA